MADWYTDRVNANRERHIASIKADLATMEATIERLRGLVEYRAKTVEILQQQREHHAS